MNDRIFLDTNTLIYLYSDDGKEKQGILGEAEDFAVITYKEFKRGDFHEKHF